MSVAPRPVRSARLAGRRVWIDPCSAVPVAQRVPRPGLPSRALVAWGVSRTCERRRRPAAATRSAPRPVPPARRPGGRPAYAAFYGQKLSWRDCGDEFECTTVTVPVDWAAPAGATVTLAIWRAARRPGQARIAAHQPRRPRGGRGRTALRSAPGYGPASAQRVRHRRLGPAGHRDLARDRCLPDAQLDAYFAVDGTPDDPGRA